jgi:glycosyltransferase involved in cell wall biosynthesis
MARLRVSVIIPARNEASCIGRCVRSVVAQMSAGDLEVIVADGGSVDGTAQIARDAGALVVANAERRTPNGLNRALQAARGEVIVRFDAHAEMPPGYVAACLRALEEEPGAVNVGGWRDPRGTGPWGTATSIALRSAFGVGNARIWRRPAPTERRHDVDTVPLGCFPAGVLRNAGGWNEEFVRNQDFELNHRLRRAGGRVVFDPAIWSVYHPRESFRALARQYWEYGLFKGKMVVQDPGSLQPRQAAPLILLGMFALAATTGRVGRTARLGVVGYISLLAAVAVRGGGRWRTVPVIAAMHLTWGGGFVYELLRRASTPASLRRVRITSPRRTNRKPRLRSGRP